MAEEAPKDIESGAAPKADAPGLDSFPGDDLAAKITAAASSAPVVIFGKVHCPFSIEARRLFAQLHVPTLDYDVDAMPHGGDVWDALKKMHAPQKTVPYVYVNKVMVGGCDATKRLQADGELVKMLHAAGVKVEAAAATDMDARLGRSGVLESSSEAGGTLFHFPEAVDNRIVRLNGFWTFVICLLVAIYYKDTGAHWVMGGLMVEYVARFIGGSNASALGAFSSLITAFADVLFILGVANFKPKFAAGPPKQFAALCGVMFSTLAFFFYLMHVHEEKLNIVGLSFTCALGAAALMESAIDFCLGCWMFGLMIKFGLVKDSVYQTFINSKVEIEYTWEDQHKRLDEGDPKLLVKRFSEIHPLVVDYKYKTKTDDMTKEDFHPVKHAKLTHFVMHLGIVGVACAWKAADPTHGGMSAPAAVYYTIGVWAAIWYFIWVVLYVFKIFLYPKKVAKELAHNVNGSCLSLPFVILVLFAFLEKDRDPVFAKVLFWIGAPTSLFLSIVWVGSWIALKKELEHVNASWMLMPVANFVSAAVGPMLDTNYRDAMQFWFAFAILMWVALFTITLYKTIVMPEYDDRVRPMIAVWVAAPAIGAIAYLACYAPSWVIENDAVSYAPGIKDDFIFINMYWMSVVLALVLGTCMMRPYLGRLRFDMSYWACSFPLAAMSMCATVYYLIKPGNLSEAIAYACLFACSWVTSMLALQTLAAMVRLQVFVPDYKWGPMSFMRLTHEALRGVLPKLLDLAKDVGEADNREALRSLWVAVKMAHLEHGRHEDTVIFPVYNEFFPHITAEADQQHHNLDAFAAKITDLIASNAPASELTPVIESYGKALDEHLRYEEDHLQCMPRKYVPLELSKQIVRKCWAATHPETWHILLPLLVESMPMLHQRVRFVKTLLWAMPERCHQFGLILCKGVNAVEWRRISAELPELVPRGVGILWERYY
ncbi:hypothetical protein HXX76_001885 [Chlamydomonas incerta]|uniref:Uncharacterized protein n=1 Tax=Chlamydomonas incerta TaxID=51695 RepID=A0A835W9N9_CHLIN|nr:hypothetical protein HXX76_001885 [Chlamydomonas incerta]|eukprot:KAG2443533.1 hypothetical protein HXX76_001885 [Chlamydomonas incerta]